MIVMKFGGSSVGSAERIKAVKEIVKSRLSKKPVVVVSAVKGVTDELLDSADRALNGDTNIEEIKEKHKTILRDLGLNGSLVDKELKELQELLDKISAVKELTPETIDHISSFGERMSSKIIAEYMKKENIQAEAFNAYDIGLITDSNFGNAEPLECSYAKINSNLSKTEAVPIITGFIGKTKDGRITTLGRGGSDYSATIMGIALHADEIEIWTDVNGILTSDPRVVSNVRTIPKVSFAEASELAYFGAKVLHPKTIYPAMKKDIPVKVLNTYEPENNGTTIVKDVEKAGTVFTAIAFKKNLSTVRIVSSRMLLAHGFLAKIFEIFDKNEIPIDVVSTSEVSVSMSTDNPKNLDKAIKELEHIGKVTSRKDRAIVCVVGNGMADTPGISGRIFTVCGNLGVNVEMISQGASEINVSFIIKNEDVERTIKALHEELIENQK